MTNAHDIDGARRSLRRKAVAAAASDQDGVLSRRQLLELGVTRWQLKAELRAERWKSHGRQTIAMHNGDLSAAAQRWTAVIECGPRAALDGISALEAAGLTGYVHDGIRVSVPRGARIIGRPGIVARQTRRLRPGDIVGAGVPRVRPPVAAVRAALWARSDRQAAVVLAMAVQQRITPAAAIGQALLEVKRHPRRRFLETTCLDLLGGAQAMGELDFAVLCRARGLPEPERQALRQTRDGQVYLDVFWRRYGVVVEVDGIQHLRADIHVADALRQNAVTLDGSTVLRLPLLGLRIAPDDFFAQIETALRRGGWHPSDVITNERRRPRNA